MCVCVCAKANSPSLAQNSVSSLFSDAVLSKQYSARFLANHGCSLDMFSLANVLDQRTPRGGGKKRVVENLTNDTPPKKGFWTPPPRTLRFPPPQVSVLCFSCTKSTTEQTRSSFGGVQKFSGERVFWYVFLPPYVLHRPISRPNLTQ